MSYLPVMENLNEKVYECTLAVEAHMICDLLARAGISSRVDGEFLAGVAGEIPLGAAVKVRVAPERAAEAREVIAEWEKLQPPPQTNPPPASSWRATAWFAGGLALGIVLTTYALRSPSATGVDYDGDGDFEVTYRYSGKTISMTEADRNDDGVTDARMRYDLRGFEKTFESDEDFDGRFEQRVDMHRGLMRTVYIDQVEDGRPEFIYHYVHGVLARGEILDESGARVVSRVAFRIDSADAELDRDGDGVFEERVHFDRLGFPRRQ